MDLLAIKCFSKSYLLCFLECKQGKNLKIIKQSFFYWQMLLAIWGKKKKNSFPARPRFAMSEKKSVWDDLADWLTDWLTDSGQVLQNCLHVTWKTMLTDIFHLPLLSRWVILFLYVCQSCLSGSKSYTLYGVCIWCGHRNLSESMLRTSHTWIKKKMKGQ